MYTLYFTVQAKKDLAFIKKNAGKTINNKIEQLLLELMQHPRTGTGRVEQLKGNRHGQWSRRIDKKHRMVYIIDDNVVTVTIIAAKGHYDDK